MIEIDSAKKHVHISFVQKYGISIGQTCPGPGPPCPTPTTPQAVLGRSLRESRVVTSPSVPAPDVDLYRLYVQQAPLRRFRSRRSHRLVLIVRLGSSLLPPSTWAISSLPRYIYNYFFLRVRDDIFVTMRHRWLC
jgi:hypothetical protein